MKRSFHILAAVLVAVSCTGNTGSFKTEVFSFADTTAHCCTSISIEIPSGKSTAESAIRDSLISFLDAETQFGEPGKATRLTRPDVSDMAGMQACIELYGRRVAEDINNTADEEESFYPWEFQTGISMSRQTEKYVVFNCTGYQYLGGAHGGITGSGPHTFNLKTASSRSRSASLSRQKRDSYSHTCSMRLPHTPQACRLSACHTIS